MKKARSNKPRQAKERNIDMAEHGMKMRALGMSERATKVVIRVLIALVPLIVITFCSTAVVTPAGTLYTTSCEKPRLNFRSAPCGCTR